MKSPNTRLREATDALEQLIETERSRTSMARGIKNDLEEIARECTTLLEMLRELYDFVLRSVPAESISNYSVLTRVEDVLLELGIVTKRVL